MAQLETPAPSGRWSIAQTRAQYAAISWLRWRIWVNGFRRKGGAGELVARIITIPIAVAFLFFPTVGAGAGSWYLASHGMLGRVSLILWAIFAFSQLLNINLGQPGTTFDPTQLIRFPMRMRSYVAVRLFFGLLAPANILGTLMSFAVFAGVCIAMPALWFWALMALAVFAATNVLFTRMVFAWVDRWLSTRRAREIFTGLIVFASLGFQYVNLTFNPAYNHHHAHTVSADRVHAVQHFYQSTRPVLGALPPGLTGNALVAANNGRYGWSILLIAGCALFAALFLTVFGLRMRAEFHGEGLSDVANAVSKSSARPIASPSARTAQTASTEFVQQSASRPPQTVLAMFGKEFLYLRRNTGLFYSLVAPLVMVLLFAGKMATRSSAPWVFPAALAYTLLGLAPLAYNSFGLEGAGTQFFFMAPVRMRDVLLGKNLLNFLLGLLEIIVVFAIIAYMAAPPTPQMFAVALLWAFGTLLLNTTLGNFRSISAPKQIQLNRMANKQASPLSALISIGVLLVAAGFGEGLLLLARYFGLSWLLVPVMLAYAIVGLLVYLAGLRSLDRYALEHREQMFEELSKQG